ncbi:MAG TPA: ABC transporter permease subunit [Myxococcota bacterium]|nr:ABC transporter permease subunit [Myxococcota bacterium]
MRAASALITAWVERGIALLAAIPPALFIALTAGLAYYLQRRVRLVVGIGAALALIFSLGLWHGMLETLVLVLLATAMAVAVGVPLGIVAAHRPWLYRAMRPLLDFMQTIPTFVYLIPTLMLFGLGVMPGLVSTVIFILPIPIRMTYLGICDTSKDLREAAEAFGATPWQRLIKVEIPCARIAIMAGVNQALMLALSMVVVASLVGAGGLGSPVVRALNTVNVAEGFEAGIAIVALAMVLDRIVKRPGGST